MNDITITSAQLPDTIEDLTQFVLIGKAKLQAYMLKLQTVTKLTVAQEIRDQTLREAQEISNAVIAAEQRIGELLSAIPKASGNQYTSANSTYIEKAKTKSETITEMGYTKDEASDYQQMAKHPEVVQKVIEDALANGEVVTKSQVLKEIRAAKEQAKAEAEANKTVREKFAEQKADRLLQENEKLKEQVTKLEGQKPEKVFPPDYEALRKKAKEAKAWEQDYHKQQEKTGEKQREILRLQDRIKELEEQTVREQTNNDFVAGAIYFIAQCGSFIRDVGGYVWIADKLADLPEKDRVGYIKAAKAVKDWAEVLLSNIERDTEYGELELRKLINQG